MVDPGQRLKMRRCTISDEMETSAEIKGGKVHSSNRWNQTETVVYSPGQRGTARWSDRTPVENAVVVSPFHSVPPSAHCS